MWLFSRRFDILSHIFNPRITKIVHTDPTIFQRMREFICSNMFSNTFAKDYCIFSRTFALCYEVLSFRAVALGPLFPSFFDDCVPFFCSWIGGMELSQFWFSLLTLLTDLPVMFVMAILFPFVLFSLIAFLPGLESSLLFLVDSVISIIDLRDTSKYWLNESVFLFHFISKI